jgi:hypothetical protein
MAMGETLFGQSLFDKLPFNVVQLSLKQALIPLDILLMNA